MPLVSQGHRRVRLLRESTTILPIKTVFLDRDAMRMDALLGAELRTPKVR